MSIARHAADGFTLRQASPAGQGQRDDGAARAGNGVVVDVSIHEALATLAIADLTRAGLTGKSWSRKRLADGNGATVCILPARDGFAAACRWRT